MHASRHPFSALCKAFGRSRRHWNIVLSDYNPGIDIRETICHLAAAHPPKRPIIIISAPSAKKPSLTCCARASPTSSAKTTSPGSYLPSTGPSTPPRPAAPNNMPSASCSCATAHLSAATNGVIITRADGDMPVVYLNPAFERLPATAPTKCSGATARYYRGDDRQQPEIAKIYTALSQGEGCQAVVRNYRKNGSAFWNCMSIWPVKDASSRTTHFVGIQEDITEQRQADDRLRQAAAVFESSTEGMMITDLSAKIIEVNRAVHEITGYEHDEVIGMSSSLLRSGQHPPQFYQSLWRSLQESGQWRGEVWNRRKNGEIYP